MLILLVSVFLLSTVLFQKAAGNLNPGKLNTISYVYYIFMLQSFAGAALIFLGFDEHYTLSYLINRDRSCFITIVAIFSTSVMLPLFLLIFQKLFRVEVRSEYRNFLKSRVEIKQSLILKICFSAVSLCAVLVLIGFFVKVGYIPLWKLIFPSDNFDSALERARISSIYFIHPYVTNILMMTVMPLLSYISFSYFIIQKTRYWGIMATVLFVAAVLVKTYKFEKSPLIFHLLVYILIYLYFKGGIKFVYMLLAGVIMGGIIIAFYRATGFSGALADIYNGPLGRTLFTEVGTLAYCFDMFPNIFPFLGGRSFTPTILKLIGMDSSKHLRSAELTMAFYGSERVYDGTAGVMNTLFIGEAYANWGMLGAVLSIVWVALVISLLFCLILKMRKTPGTIAFLAVVTMRIGSMLEGGFCDFVYSFDLLFTIICFVSLYLFFERPGRLNEYMVAIEKKAELFYKKRTGKQNV